MPLFPHKKTLLANISLSLAAVIFTLGAVEYALRCRAGEETRLRECRYAVADTLPCSWIHANHPELLEKLKGGSKDESRTVLLMGDSVMAGLNSGEPQPFRSKRTLIYNFAVDGYDLQQSVAYLKYLLAIKKPDMIIIGICLNDIVSYHGQMLDQIRIFGPVYSALGPLRNSALVSLCVRAYLRYRISRRSGVVPLCVRERDRQAEKSCRGPFVPDEVLMKSRKAAEKALGSSWPLLGLIEEYSDPVKFYTQISHPLAELAGMGVKRKIRVVVWPVDAGVEPYWFETVRRKIETEVRRHGLQTIDLMGTYKAGCRDKCFVEDRVHFSGYGRKLFFGRIVENF